MVAGARIVIAPQSKDWRDKQHSTLLCIHIKDGSAIGAQSVCPMELLAIMAAIQLAAHVQTPTTKNSHRLPGMLSDSQQKEAAPTTHQQLHCTYESTTALFERLQRHDQVKPIPTGEEELNVSRLVKRRLPEPCRRQSRHRKCKL